MYYPTDFKTFNGVGVGGQPGRQPSTYVRYGINNLGKTTFGRSRISKPGILTYIHIVFF